jgi:hypothetical protein
LFLRYRPVRQEHHRTDGGLYQPIEVRIRGGLCKRLTSLPEGFPTRLSQIRGTLPQLLADVIQR